MQFHVLDFPGYGTLQRMSIHLCRVSLVPRLFSRPARYGEAIRAFSSGTHTSGRFFITSTSAMLKPTEDGWQTTAAVSSKNTGENTSCSKS